MEEEKIKKFLRQQLQWLVAGDISEGNFKHKLADCKKDYPDFDYEAEFAIMVKELEEQKEKLKEMANR